MKNRILSVALCSLFICALCGCSENSANGQVETINGSINNASIESSNINWENVPLTPESDFETKILSDEV